MGLMMKICAACLIVEIACLSLTAANGTAQTYEVTPPEGRGGSFTVLLFSYNPSTNWRGQGGSVMDLDDAWGAGFGFGYHFSRQFQLNGTVSWSDRDYTATIVNADGSTRQYSSTLDSTTLFLSSSFYLFKGKISPYLSGGIGLTNIDSNIQTGSATTECWYDPWYGNICSFDVPTKNETFLSYTAGLGINFDISPRYSLQTSYNKMWLDVRRAPDMPDFNVWRLDLLFRIP